jgi:hypothetical protein
MLHVARDASQQNVSANGRYGSKADVTSLESDVCITPESRHHPTQPLLHMIFHWMGPGFFVLKHRAEIAHVEITAAQFAFPKMFSFARRAGLFQSSGPNLNLAVAGFQIRLLLSARCRSWSRVAYRQGPRCILAWSAEVHARRGYLQRS